MTDTDNRDYNACKIPDERQAGEILKDTVNEEAIYLKTLISSINPGLTVPLFAIYISIYRKVKSSFTPGLMAVIPAPGIYAATSNPTIITLPGGFPGYIGTFQIIPDICATVARIIIIRISPE